MTRDISEREYLARFDVRYQNIMAPLSLDIEEETMGTRNGVVSWSLPTQVEMMAEACGLRPGEPCLDIGSGAGWPGTKIRQLTGADVTFSDITIEGLMVIAGSHPETSVVQSDASLLPFASDYFRAVTHSDVLCCLPRKVETLRECHRVLAEDGVMVFAVIATGRDLSSERLAELDRIGNEYVFSDHPYDVMLEETMFSAEIVDVTSEFRDLADRLHRARSARYDDLVDLWGEEDALSMVERAEFNRDAVDRGDLVRHLVVARPVPTRTQSAPT